MATAEQKQAFYKISDQMKSKGKRMLIVNRLRPANEMIESIVNFLLVKQMKVNKLLAQTNEIQQFLDDIASKIAVIYSDIIETKTSEEKIQDKKYKVYTFINTALCNNERNRRNPRELAIRDPVEH